MYEHKNTVIQPLKPQYINYLFVFPTPWKVTSIQAGMEESKETPWIFFRVMLFFRWRETPAPTDASHGAPLQRWSIPRWYLTSQWEAPILVRAGWALFFSLVVLVSVEKGKQRYNKATEGDQQADHPYEYQNDICSCHWRHLPSYVFRQAGHWLGRLPPLSWVPWMDSITMQQEFQ